MECSVVDEHPEPTRVNGSPSRLKSRRMRRTQSPGETTYTNTHSAHPDGLDHASDGDAARAFASGPRSQRCWRAHQRHVPNGGVHLRGKFRGNRAVVPVDDGRYSLRLSNIESADFDGATRYLEVVVDGVAQQPRTPILWVPYAIRAGAVTLGDEPGPCTPGAAGSLRFNGGQLQFCDGVNTEWRTVETSGSTDGTTCPSIKTEFPSSASDVYVIDPANERSPIQVCCDMVGDGGGWTLVSRVVLGANILQTGAVGTGAILPNQSTFGKLSHATIASIRRHARLRSSPPLAVVCLSEHALQLARLPRRRIQRRQQRQRQRNDVGEVGP